MSAHRRPDDFADAPSSPGLAPSVSRCLWEALGLELGSLPADSAVMRAVRELAASTIVNASGVTTPVRITAGDLESQLLPLALAFLNRQRAAQQRILVGLAGGAGTGKTILSQLLCRVLQTLAGSEIAVAVSMDGYHLPNAILDSRFGCENGAEVRLREIKGRPPTFAADAFAADLARLRHAAGQEEAIRLPVYDRQRHEPVPDALAVQPCHRIVIVEGLHLLRPEPGWNEVRAAVDFCVLLEVPLATCRQRVVARKVAGGRTAPEAEAHFERVDRPTIEELQTPAQRDRADLVIQLAEPAASDPGGPSLVVSGCERRTALDTPLGFRPIANRDLHLLAIGLNPALQKTLVFERWDRGKVNRARSLLTSVGGKGQQFSRAASRIVPGQITVAQFLGGDNGARLARLLTAAGVTPLTVPVEGETRCCTTVLDATTGEATELVEPSLPIPPDPVARLAARLREILARGEISALALCGTYPPGVDAEFYATLAREKGRALLLLDSYQGIDATLATGQVDVLKLNADEVRLLAARSQPDLLAAPGDPPAALPEIARAIFAAHRLRWLAVTDGPGTAWLFVAPASSDPAGRPGVSRTFEYHLPPVAGVVNPIGAGDTVAAVFLAQLAAGEAPEVAFAGGLAAGSASCRQLGGADFTLDDLHAILAGIRVSCLTTWR